MSNEEKLPLPIWFFVGVILLVYGVLIIVGQAVDTGDHVLSNIKPGYMWGPVLLVGGAIITVVGLVTHKKH